MVSLFGAHRLGSVAQLVDTSPVRLASAVLSRLAHAMMLCRTHTGVVHRFLRWERERGKVYVACGALWFAGVDAIYALPLTEAVALERRCKTCFRRVRLDR